MKVDKDYCMNSFLQFRFIHDNKMFKENLTPNYYDIEKNYIVNNSEELESAIKDYIAKNVDESTVLMLSSGIDSAILAKYMPKGSKVFTLQCVANEPTINEVIPAKKIAEHNGLEQEVIEITWEDYEKYCPILFEHKKVPFHSIEVQIYKAALRAKELGYKKLLFGESADAVFGGLDGLLSIQRNVEEFSERFNNVNPEIVLKNAEKILEYYEQYEENGVVNTHKFINNIFFKESVNSYKNACETAGVEFIGPYVEMEMGVPLDLERIKSGDSKYIVRELFKKLYPNFEMTPKIPMPRPMDLWLKDWDGPKRKEFKEDCIKNIKADQKWLVYILEKYLNYFEIEE